MSVPAALNEAATVLVVPGGLAESLAFREASAGKDMFLIGASSLRNDPAQGEYQDWCYLPTIHDPEFDAALQSILLSRGIKTVYCPHPILHARLEQFGQQNDGAFDLLNPPPQAAYERKVASDIRRAGEVIPFLSALGDDERSLAKVEIAALLRACEDIVGQSDETKLAAMMAVFPQLPSGDVVEIGGFWGRSAFALAWLTARYDNGPVLVIDPWRAEDAVQQSVSALVQRDTYAQDWELIHQGFLLNLLPVGRGRLGYLRMTSAAGAKCYAKAPCRIDSPPFGTLSYSGAIALLHIDGNHDAAAAAMDVALWSKHVRPGGWIVLDDYVWPHGDGPARAGDALLRDLGDKMQCSFVAGKALFIRMA